MKNLKCLLGFHKWEEIKIYKGITYNIIKKRVCERCFKVKDISEQSEDSVIEELKEKYLTKNVISEQSKNYLIEELKENDNFRKRSLTKAAKKVYR